MFDLFIVLLLAYVLGSIPFGLIFAKFLGVKDLRKSGSGNIGATNAMRVGGKRLGSITLIADALKGVLAVLLARMYIDIEYIEYLAAFAAVFGHVYPIWLGFKGGKGVATTIAVLLTIHPGIGLFMCGVWLITFCISRVSAVSSIFSMMCTNLLALLIGDVYFGLVVCALTILVVYKHHDNIKRLMIGE